MVLKVVLAAMMATACAMTGAQVFRCPDKATGHITYSDVACADGRQIVRERTPEERQQDAERAERARHGSEPDAVRPPLADPAVHAPAPVASHPAIDPFLCKAARRNLSVASNMQSGSPMDKRRRMNAAIIDVNAACGTQTELIQEPVRVEVNPPHNSAPCESTGHNIRCN